MEMTQPPVDFRTAKSDESPATAPANQPVGPATSSDVSIVIPRVDASASTPPLILPEPTQDPAEISASPAEIVHPTVVQVEAMIPNQPVGPATSSDVSIVIPLVDALVSTPPTSRPLPTVMVSDHPNWIVKHDASTGRPFYVNLTTKRSQWIVPPELRATNTTQELSEKKVLSDDQKYTDLPLSGGWVRKWAADKQRFYYANKALQKTTWTAPASAQEPSKQGKASESVWRQKTDPKSGRSYFVNSKTNEKQWKKPEGV
jgi:hypothetical protein